MDYKKQRIKTSVVACIIDETQRVLLTRRAVPPFLDQWVMPGGGIEHGEAILSALHREVREEVGIEVHVDGLLDVFEHIGVGERNDHFVILYYRAHPLTFELHPDGRECSEARWVPAGELSSLDIPPGTRHILAKLFPEVGWGNGAPPARSAAREIP